MAMLAERRRRKRYNLVPRGQPLFDDETRYGTKMLEKMGWSKGKGLGANENGNLDFIRVAYKNDAGGIGYEMRDDQWTEHEKGFNGFLKLLNAEACETIQSDATDNECDRVGFGFGFQQATANEPTTKNTKEKFRENISGVSLEERSKSSKARVHYKKWVKGKDISQYSEKDLANIFGKKVSEVAVEDEPSQTEQLMELPKDNNFGGVQTVSTGLSVTDYFKQKMAALRTRSKPVGETPEQRNPTEGIVCVEEAIQEKKSKKKQRENSNEEIKVDDDIEECQKAKKNKEHIEPNDNDEKLAIFTIEEDSSQIIESQNQDDLDATRKKNKKRKKRDEDVNSDEANKAAAAESQLPNEPATQTEVDCCATKKKKRNKRERLNEANSTEVIIEMHDDNVEIRRKDKKRKSLDEAKPTNFNEELLRKKRKKNCDESTDKTVDEVLNAKEGLNAEETIEPANDKKSKKRSKKVQLPEEPENETQPRQNKKKRKKESLNEELAKETENTTTKGETEDDKIRNKQNKANENAPAKLELIRRAPNVNNKTPANTENEKLKDSITAQKNVPKLTLIPYIEDLSDGCGNISELNHKMDAYLSEMSKKLENATNLRISTFCAEKFRLLGLSKFENTNFAENPGFGLKPDIGLQIFEGAFDAQRIVDLWKCKNAKYEGAPTYRTFIKEAKKNPNKRLSNKSLKALKRKCKFNTILQT